LWNKAVERHIKESRSPLILHLATHGFFLPNQAHVTAEPASRSEDSEWVGSADVRVGGPETENPLLRSGLAFAGANTWLNGGSTLAAAEDGILNAIEVSSLELLGTELVVLSACETGLGTVHVWEGVFGLRRAFALAGAKTLVITLWKVADRQTVELMVSFYQQLLSGKSRGEALRGAQLELKKRFPSPFYWAAFICQGDSGPLTVTFDRI
jgi:CHAT domain-containing protein